MLKYVGFDIVFREIPDETTLAINISNCPCHCKGCHSSYLAGDVGEVLTITRIEKLINENKGITAICFMEWQQTVPLDIKIGWYSGRATLADEIDLYNFDYIKLGPYIEECGPLDNPNTNQRLYKTIMTDDGPKLKDITFRFWNREL